MKEVIKPLLGIVLLCLVFAQLNTHRLFELSQEVRWPWFIAALLCSTLNSFISALRWRRVASHLDIVITPALALRVYFQGVAANTVVPGGILGGDVWRAGVLVSRGASKTSAAVCVFLDRICGLWVLGALSLVASIVWAAAGMTGALGVFALPYVGGLLALVLAPGLLYFFRRPYIKVLLYTANLSAFVQVFSIAALWCSLAAVGTYVDVWALATLASLIFLAAVVPVAVGGFGSREVGAVIALSYIGVARESSFMASVIFGLTFTVQGLIGVYFWLVDPAKRTSC